MNAISRSTDERTRKIAALNDHAREHMGIACNAFVTEGIRNLPLADGIAILGQVLNFKDFTPDNDPHGEHDFGAFTYKEHKIFWKIDYYAADDLSLTQGSEDPADPKATLRVLTIMLASEY